MGEPARPERARPEGMRGRGPLARLHASRWGNVLVLGVTTVLILAAVWAVGTWRNTDQGGAGGDGAVGQVSRVDVPDSTQPAPKVGESAPQFVAATTSGQSVDLAGLRGTPVWLVFNATWCANCRAETPDVQTVHEELGDQVRIVSVYLSDRPSDVRAFGETLGLTFDQVVDDNNGLGALYRVIGVPAHYFIDADGVVQAIDVGTLSLAQMRAEVAALLP